MPENTFYTAADEERLEGVLDPQEGDTRSGFQIDRDRILFAPAFRRLQGKTQVFQAGAYDFYRTRLTHTIEVARISRSIAEHLNARAPQLGPERQIDVDLVEAVGLTHDLGHPPFGHIGERSLNALMREHGGFEGNAQSLRLVAEQLFEEGDWARGMNPTRAFLDGILKYKDLRREKETQPPANKFLYDEQEPVRAFVERGLVERAPSLECQIMDWADDVAYSVHDIADGVRGGFITVAAIAAWARARGLEGEEAAVAEHLCERLAQGALEASLANRVGEAIRGCTLSETGTEGPPRRRYRLEVSPQTRVRVKLYKRLAVELIFQRRELQELEFRCGRLLEELFRALQESPLKLLPERHLREIAEGRERALVVCDFLASLTDGQASRLHRRLFGADFAGLGEPG